VIEEFVITARGGSWFQSGGRAGRVCTSLEEHLRARPDTLRGFSGLFAADVGGAQDSAGGEEGLDGAHPGAFTVRGQRFVVVRRTWNSLCMLTKFRREGLVVCQLPAGILLCCSFKAPVLAQQAVNAVEKACEALWR
jgi:hypothetical protein